VLRPFASRAADFRRRSARGSFESNGDPRLESETWTAYRWHDGKAELFE
jgi:hypothetical protein